jgi:hypothetical protein
MSWWADLVEVVSGTLGGESNITNPSGPVAGTVAGAVQAGGFITVIEGIWAGLTDGKMWRSLGWLLLGIVLMLLAVGWWIGPSAARRSPLGMAAEGLG